MICKTLNFLNFRTRPFFSRGKGGKLYWTTSRPTRWVTAQLQPSHTFSKYLKEESSHNKLTTLHTVTYSPTHCYKQCVSMCRVVLWWPRGLAARGSPGFRPREPWSRTPRAVQAARWTGRLARAPRTGSRAHGGSAASRPFRSAPRPVPGRRPRWRGPRPEAIESNGLAGKNRRMRSSEGGGSTSVVLKCELDSHAG